MALMMGLAAMVSCQNGKTKQDQTGVDSVAAVCGSDSVSIALGDSLADVDVLLVFPTGDEVLSDSVVRWLGGQMQTLWLTEGTEQAIPAYRGKDKTLKAQAEYYGRTAYGRMQAQAADELRMMRESGFSGSRPAYHVSMQAKPFCDTSKFLTYKSVQYSFSGGAHGSTSETYATFCKRDGHLLTATLQPACGPQIQPLLRDGLLRYFSAQMEDGQANDLSASNITQYLFADEVADGIPLPQQMPVMTSDGLLFIYQQYEIAPYAAGILTFTVPYSDIEPYMTDEAKALR